jgi:hypothetical protein
MTTTMTPAQLEETLEREFAIYKDEVAAASDPKLHILIVHLYVEHLLERYLATRLKTTKTLFGKNGLTFEKKALLVEALGGLTPQRIDSVRKLNALRNDCAHKFKYHPSATGLDEFGRTLGKPYTAIKAKYGSDHNGCMRYVCARLSGELLRLVVSAEHDVI